MRPRERQETGEQDLFRSRLDRIIDLTHALVKLSRAIDWRFLEAQSPGREARVDQALRYAHAHQFKRANRSLRRLKTYLGRVIRDIGRRIDGDPELEEIFAWPLSLSRRVLAQDQRQRGPKVYSLHAPEVECIGKGKAHRPYEFGVKVS